MKVKMEEKGGKKAKGNRGGEGGIYIREMYTVEHPGSKRGRRGHTEKHREREREQTYPEQKNETNSDGLEVNPRQEETDWRYLKLSFSQPDA